MNILLHPTDFAPNSDEAFLTACAIARDQKALLFVLHVVNPNAISPDDRLGDELNPARELYHKIWNQFDRMREMAGEACVDFEVRVGDVCGSITDFATAKHCDMIVLAGRNKPDTHYQTYGCISEGLIRRAPCGVFVLRNCHAEKMSLPASGEGDQYSFATPSAQAGNFDFRYRAAK